MTEHTHPHPLDPPHMDPDDPAYDGFRIQEMWAFTAIGPDDQEGVMAMLMDGQPIPMIASDRRRFDSLRAMIDDLPPGSPMVRVRHFVPAPDDGVVLE